MLQKFEWQKPIGLLVSCCCSVHIAGLSDGLPWVAEAQHTQNETCCSHGIHLQPCSPWPYKLRIPQCLHSPAAHCGGSGGGRRHRRPRNNSLLSYWLKLDVSAGGTCARHVATTVWGATSHAPTQRARPGAGTHGMGCAWMIALVQQQCGGSRHQDSDMHPSASLGADSKLHQLAAGKQLAAATDAASTSLLTICGSERVHAQGHTGTAKGVLTCIAGSAAHHGQSVLHKDRHW